MNLGKNLTPEQRAEAGALLLNLNACMARLVELAEAGARAP